MARSKVLPTLTLSLACLVVFGCSSDDNGSASKSTGTAKVTTTTTATSGVPAGPSTSGAPATATSTPPVGVSSVPTVGQGERSDLGGGVSAMVTDKESVDVKARAPGETSGPAVAVTLEVRNGSSQPFDLSQLTVTASYGDNVPAIPSGAEPAAVLSGSLGPGQRRSGVYVFRVPDATTEPVIVNVQSGSSPNSLSFRV